jgi:LysR family transcriptional regulator, transcriptional activator of the cysJI operon
MHLETLNIFCDIVELGSFSKTAEKHLLSQSAISQQLAQLEGIYKSRLINRKKRPIELTKPGQLLYQAAKEMLERHELFKSELSGLKSSFGSRLNVAAIFSIGMHALPDYVKRFMVNFPNTNIHIEFLHPEKIYEQVISGEVDIGLVAIPKRDKRLEVFDFELEPLVLACSPKHPFAYEHTIDINRLQFERFIAFEKGVPSRDWIDGIFARYNLMVRPIMEFDNIETIKRAIEINSGVSILPRTAILQELNGESICAIPFSNEQFTRPTGIITRKDKSLGQAGRYLIEMLRKEQTQP